MIAACLSVGLYPNIGELTKGLNGKKLLNVHGHRMDLHPSTIIHRQILQQGWLAYLQNTSHGLRMLTLVPELAISLLLGNQARLISTQTDDENIECIIEISSNINLKIEEEHFQFRCELQAMFLQWLEDVEHFSFNEVTIRTMTNLLCSRIQSGTPHIAQPIVPILDENQISRCIECDQSFPINHYQKHRREYHGANSHKNCISHQLFR